MALLKSGATPAEPRADDNLPPEKLVGALASGLGVLRHLCASRQPLGVSRIARDLNLHSSTCFNLLKTLVHERLVQFDEITKTYTVGLGLVALTKGVLEQASLVVTLRPQLRLLASSHRVTATLWQVTDDERVVLIDRADNDAAFRVHMSLGQRLPMYLAAMGRCIAGRSRLDKKELKNRFDNLRWEAGLTFDTYFDEAQQARQRGYAVDDGLYVKGVTSVSAVVLGSEGDPVMAISAVGFSGQFNSMAIEQLGEDLKILAAEVSSALAGKPANKHRASEEPDLPSPKP